MSQVVLKYNRSYYLVNWKSALCPGGGQARICGQQKRGYVLCNASVARRLVTVGAASGGGGVPLSPAGLDTEKLWGGTILARVRVPGGGNIVTR